MDMITLVSKTLVTDENQKKELIDKINKLNEIELESDKLADHTNNN